MSSRSVRHLQQEHREIYRTLDAFKGYLDKCGQPDAPNRKTLWGVIDSLQEGIFLRHEEKEELIILPELARQGLSWSDGTLAQVRQDHRQARYLLRNLFQGVHQSNEPSQEEQRHFKSLGEEWVNFLVQHMKQEESLLFPFIDGELTDAQDANIEKQFKALDDEFAAMPDYDRLRSSRLEFIAKYGGT